MAHHFARLGPRDHLHFSVSITGLLAIRDGRFDPVLRLLAAVALLLAHATNNLLNDLTDDLKGVDRR